jgi:hypothetical protein
MIVPSLLRLRAARAASQSSTRLESPGSQTVALHRLMRDRSKALGDRLQDTVEAASELCETDCAGITRLERLPEGAEALRWIAATGPLRLAIGQSMGLDRNLRSVFKEQKPRLVFHPHRLFSHIAEAWHVSEALLVPWGNKTSESSQTESSQTESSGRSGILWVVQRDGSKRLDADDIRVLTHLAAFAAFIVARQEIETLRRNAERSSAASQVAHELAHAVNNPLQALTNSLSRMNPNPSPHLQDAQPQRRRIKTSARALLSANANPSKN